MPAVATWSRQLALLLLVAVVGGACSSEPPANEGATNDTTGPSILEPTPTPEGELETTELSEEEQGTLVNRFDLEIGQCFNTYGLVSVDEEIQPTTRSLSCDDPHESEVYFQRSYPAGSDQPYPGEPELEEWANVRCYREFENFVGVSYEVSALEIGTVIPTPESWVDGLHREVTCFVYSMDGGGLQGSMAGTAL